MNYNRESDLIRVALLKFIDIAFFFNSVKTIKRDASSQRGQESGTLRTQYIEHERADR